MINCNYFIGSLFSNKRCLSLFICKHCLCTKLPEPPLPDTCCMSGCVNCVYLNYARDLENFFKDGGLKAANQIDKLVQDPNMRAYLKMELKIKQNASQDD